MKTGAAPDPSREVLDRRARALAVPLLETVIDAGVMQLVVFPLGAGRYGVEGSGVRGIAWLGRVAVVPGAPEGIAGITMHLGDLLVIADLRALLGIPAAESGGRRSLLVLADGAGQLGIVFEGFADMATAGATADTGLPRSGHAAGLIRGMTPDGIAIIDLPALLTHPDLSSSPAGAINR